ncbi:MAG: nucleotidyltransferase domain-containing protein [Myxococcales bacterium]|nr:nucleotidyltransferase domain-containing protein [Myxococcales bacterium]
MREGTLTPHKIEVMGRASGEEQQNRSHPVIALSGAHAYGFPSPDSDLDLKAIHVERAERLLGLSVPRAVRNRLEIIEGVEVDYTSNELQVALRGLLRGDGNMLERVLSVAPLRDSPWRAELAELARRNLSRRYHHHYRGFAHSQRRAVDQSAAPRAKKVLYVLRTALTGAHLLRTGECVPDLTELFGPYGLGVVPALIEIKQQGEQRELPTALAQQVGPALDRAFALLDAARDRSPLPEEPAEVEALERWLVGVRRGDLAE